MKLWLVDHTNGVALVAAPSRAKAMEWVDPVGEALAAYEYRGQLLLEIARDTEDGDDGEKFDVLRVGFEGSAGCHDEVMEAIEEHNISFTQDEYKANGPSE